MSNNNFVLEYVCGLIQKNGKFPAACNIAEFNYIDTGYVDSIAIIKFILDIEAKFDIEISEEDMLSPQFRTVGGLVAIVEEKVSNKKRLASNPLEILEK